MSNPLVVSRKFLKATHNFSFWLMKKIEVVSRKFLKATHNFVQYSITYFVRCKQKIFEGYSQLFLLR